MHQEATCPDCGSVLPPNSPEGLCVQCLYQAAVEHRHDRNLHIRCPHCENPVELVDDSPLADLTCPTCGSTFSLISSDETLRPRRQIEQALDRFELLEQVGIGQFGSVWKARDTELDRIVAIKIPRRGQLSESEAEQFLREARAAAQLKHPHIVSTHEVGRTDQTIYIVNDFVQGANLSEWLRDQRLTTREAARLCQKVAEALHHAHEAGVIHRDLKPSNIMIDVEGEPHLADFGLAKREAGEITITAEGHVLGTPAYMSPEQAGGTGHTADRRTDIYSLGVVLYELLTGDRPFRGETRMLIVQILGEEPVAPRKLNARIPRDLETICLKCLEKDPGRRYPTAQALADDLARWLNGEPIEARPIGKIQRGWRWCRRKPIVAGLTATAITLLVATAAVSTSAYFREATLRTIADDALKNESLAHDAAETALRNESAAREREEEAKREVERQLADNYLYRGRRISEAGEYGTGLLWLARALEVLPDDSPGLERAIRMNISTTYHQLHALERLIEHDDRVTSVAYSPDGKLMLIGSGDRGPDYATGEARLWNAETGKPIGPLLAHEHTVLAVSFSPDGKVFATATGEFHNTCAGAVQLWETATGNPIGTPLPHEHSVWAVDFSPDGKTLVTGCGAYSYDAPRHGIVRLWSSETGRPVGNAIELPYPVFSAAFSPDGQSILTAGGTVGSGEALLWEIETKKPGIWDLITRKPFATRRTSVGRLRHPKRILSAVFSPDGRRILTVAYDNTAQLWDARTGQAIGEPLQHPSVLLAAAFHPLGQSFVTACDDGYVRVWDTETQSLIGQRLLHGDAVGAVAYSPDGLRILTGSDDHAARIWRVATGRSAARAIPYRPNMQGQFAVYTPDGRFILSGTILYEAGTGLRVATMEKIRTLDAIAFRHDGKRAVAAMGDSARIWDIATGSLLPAPEFRHDDRLNSVAFSPDDRYVLTGSRDRTVRVWDAESGEQVGESIRHNSWVHAVAYSPDGRYFVSGTADGTVRAFDAATRKQIGRTMRHDDTVWSIAFHVDGRTFVTASEDKTARFWDVTTTQPVRRPLQHNSLVTWIDWSPDGALVLTGCQDGSVQFWDAKSGRPLGNRLRHAGPVMHVMFASDGKTALSASKGTGRSLRQWSVPTLFTGAPRQVALWAEAASGTELTDAGTVNVLTAAELLRRNSDLEALGGLQLAVDDDPRPLLNLSALWAEEDQARRLLRRGEAQLAVEKLRKSLELRRQWFSEHPERVADGLNDLANAVRANGDPLEADRLFAEALRLWDWPQENAESPQIDGPLFHIDLQPHLTWTRTDTTGRKGNNLANLPRGTQVFESVSFQFSDGAIQLGGRWLKNKPTRVDGINVDQKVRTLHFLHSAQWGFVSGIDLGRYEVHYDDGTTETIPIKGGRDVRDWWWNRDLPPDDFHVVWVGTNDAADSPSKIQISRTKWVNPHPGKPITSLSFVCANPHAEPAPFCVAITAELTSAESDEPVTGASSD